MTPGSLGVVASAHPVNRAAVSSAPASSRGLVTITTLADLPASAAEGALFYVTDASC